MHHNSECQCSRCIATEEPVLESQFIADDHGVYHFESFEYQHGIWWVHSRFDSYDREYQSQGATFKADVWNRISLRVRA